MEDVKKYILSLAEVGLYKARIEEDGKELIFADNKFEERTLPGKAQTFDETEELSVIDVEKEKELARGTKHREKQPLEEAQIEEEPESYRVSSTKKWFRVAIFVVPVIAAAVIFLLTNPPKKVKIGLDPQETGSGSQVEIVENDTPVDPGTELTDNRAGETTGEEAGESQGGETEAIGGGTAGGAGEESGVMQAAGLAGEKTGDTPTGENTDPGVKTEGVETQSPESKQEGTDIRKDVRDIKQPDKQPVETVIKTPTIQTVKIVRLPVGLIKQYNDELSKLVIPFIPVKIKVTGFLNVKISVDKKGNAQAKILSSEGLRVTPEGRRTNVLNLIIKKISAVKLTPPKDKQGKPVRVSWFNIDYQAGKFRTRLILKKR